MARKTTHPGDTPPKKKKPRTKPAGKSPAGKRAGKERQPAAPAPPLAGSDLPAESTPRAVAPAKTAAPSSREVLKKKKAHPPAKPADDTGDLEVDPEALSRGDNPMTLVGHLHEMRSRLLIALGSIVVVMIAGFFFSDYIMWVINRPFLATGQKLNLFTLFEGFTLRLKSSLFASLLICLPLIIYQVWKYIEPAVNRNDRLMMRLTLVFTGLLFYAGVAFTYFFLPVAIMALMAFAPPDMLITNNATEYFNFFVMTAIILGAVFELPIVMLLLTKMGIVSPAFLVGKRKYAIVLIWILAALVSPGPDPLSQALLAVPLMLLYELSIVISKIIVRRKKKKELAERM